MADLVLKPIRREIPLSQWAVAAPCSSESFKTRDQKGKPLANDWSRKYSCECLF